MRPSHSAVPFSSETRVSPVEELMQQKAGVAGSLVEALVCETHAAALLTATVTSAINAMRDTGRIERPEAISRFVPLAPSILLAARAALPEARIPPQTLEAVVLFFEALRPARFHLDGFFDEARSLGFERAEILHRAQLATSWRYACREAVEAVHALDRAFRHAILDRYSESVPVLLSLLNSAAEGLQPCLDAAGQPYVPELPQRRLAVRRGLFQRCVVQHSRRSVRALVRDVSMGGLGLDGVEGLIPDEVVVVDLQCGRRFVGKVEWACERLAGISFSRLLPPNDPLLFG